MDMTTKPDIGIARYMMPEEANAVGLTQECIIVGETNSVSIWLKQTKHWKMVEGEDLKWMQKQLKELWSQSSCSKRSNQMRMFRDT
jgi:DNA-binding transcriptional regulator/RsmH inhibitor MraZ